MTTAAAKQEAIAPVKNGAMTRSVTEQVLIDGDLKNLTKEERLLYYNAVCESLGMNPLTRPFEYITLNGKLTFYARKDCTEQLRRIHNISCQIESREILDGIFVVTAKATMPNGRTDSSIGAIALDQLKGEARANAFMKSETKAKRRVTLSICGLGLLDESEVDSIPSAVIGEPEPRAAAKQPVQSSDPEELSAILAAFAAAKGGNIGKIIEEFTIEFQTKFGEEGRARVNSELGKFRALWPKDKPTPIKAYRELIRKLYEAKVELQAAKDLEMSDRAFDLLAEAGRE